MTNYEIKQRSEIENWKKEEPGVVSEITGYIFQPVSWLVRQIIPEKAFQSAIESCNGMSKKLINFEDFKKEANIFVTVRLAGLRYTINGEIGSPGTNTIYQDRVTIMEAIANSGDIPITGNRKEVQIIRKFPHGFETYSIDLTKESAMNSPYFYIQPNDYIIIKPLKQKTWGTGVTGVQSVATIMTAISLITTLLVLSKTL